MTSFDGTPVAPMPRMTSSTSDRRVWFITGASKGFGLEIARQTLARGHAVVATARRPRDVDAALGSSPALLSVALDVDDPAQAAAAVAAATERFGRIDILVNNAGRGLLGSVEEASDAETRAVFDTNVFGLLTVTRAVLPVMRAQRGGRVVNLSSVGGMSASAGWGVYSATKFAVEGLSEALRAELAPLGIDVIVVEPGTFRTDFLDASSLQRVAASIPDYADTAGRTRTWADDANHAQLGDPVKGVAAMIDVALSERPPFRLPLGADCVARVEAKLKSVAEDLERTRAIALSTGHEEAKPSAGVPD